MDNRPVKRKVDYIDEKNSEKFIKKIKKFNDQENYGDSDIVTLLSKYRIRCEEEDYGHYVQTDFYGCFNHNQLNQNNQNNQNNQSNSDCEFINCNFRSNKRF